MFRFTKAIMNNLNKTSYIRNINSLRLKTNHQSMSDTKDLVDDKECTLEDIKRLETSVRENNLKVFLDVYLSLRKARFFVVSLPAMLTAATIGLCTLPSRYNDQKNVDIYQGYHKLYNSELGETEFSKKYYKTTDTDTFLARHISLDNEEEIEEVSSISNDSLTFKMYDDVKSIFAKFNLSEDGELQLKSANLGDYIDVNDYKDYDFNNLSTTEYETLINRIINILSASDLLNEEEKQTLKSLNASEKKIIITDVVNYTKSGKEDVLISKTRFALKVILCIITLIYIVVEFCYFLDTGYSPRENNEIENNDGVLDYGFVKKVGLIYGPIMCKETFMAAERDRILNLKKELHDNTETVGLNTSPILTKYEKRLK